MSQHTPGPWRLPPIEAGSPWNIEGPNGESVAIAFQLTNVRTDPAQSVRHANARLIAAAPDLLALVREGTTRFPVTKAERKAHIEWINRARALLSRLDGRVTP